MHFTFRGKRKLPPPNTVKQLKNKPAILFEGGFITNSAEGRKIHTESYREELTGAIANAIVKFQKAVGR